MLATFHPRTLQFRVRDIVTVIAGYTHLRWYVAYQANGIYTPITAEAAAAPTATAEGTQFNLTDTELEIQVDGVEYTVPFVDPNPYSPSDVVDAITAVVGANLTYTANADSVVLTGTTAGRDGSLVVGGDANLELSFYGEEVGLDADTLLVDGTETYTLVDYHSDADHWYRVEYVDPSLGYVSPRSLPFAATAQPTLTEADMIVAYVNLSDAGGRPVTAQKVTVHVTGGTVVSGRLLTKAALTVETDASGYAEVRIPRGVIITANIVGSGWVRTLNTPTEGASFDLLDPNLDITDEFGIQEPNIDFAVRTS